MRRCSFAVAAIILAMVLAIGLTWAKDTKTSQKMETSQPQPVTCEKKCAAEKTCAKAEAMTSGDVKGRCAGAKSCQGSSGCRAMMASMPGQGMMDTHCRMMDRGGRPGMSQHRSMSPGFRHLGGPDHFVNMAQQLELTEKQVEDLKALQSNQEKMAIEMRAKIEIAQVELKDLMDRDMIDFGKIRTKISQISDMKKEMHLARWSGIERSHRLLTPEQMEKAKILRKHGNGMKKGSRQMIKEIIIEETEQ
jgi:Spy/CpxP family protein refolding chaperone